MPEQKTIVGGHPMRLREMRDDYGLDGEVRDGDF
jgi:hypothetical protein